MRRSILGSTLLAVTLGCASAPTIHPYVESDYAPYRNASPTTSLSGQAFMKTRGGEIRYAAGSVVILDPATPHGEDVARSLIAGKPIPPDDPRIASFQKTTLADAEGRFRFVGLASGDYIVRTYVIWEYATQSGLQPTGGWIYNRVTVHENESATVVVSTRRLE